MKQRLITNALLAACLMAGGSIATAPSADASTPTCTTSSYLGWTVGDVTYNQYPPKSSGGSISCLMKVGVGGVSAIKSLQSALVQCYGRGIAVDGVFGSGTRQALQYAQGVEGVVADGVYGPATASVLKRWTVRTYSGGVGGEGCYRAYQS